MMIPLHALLHSNPYKLIPVRVGCILFFFLLSFILLTNTAKAQVATYYNFAQTSGTYTAGTSGFIDTTGAATNTPASIFATAWDDMSAIFRLPFNFTYNGILYPAGTGRIGLDTDGWFTFSNGNPDMSTSTGTGASWVSISDQTGVYFYGTALNNGFAGFNCDLNEQTFTTITGTLSNGNPTITAVSSVANIMVGTRLSGTGIPNGTIVTAFTATTITMSTNATANGNQTITPRSSIFAFVTGTAPNRKFIVQWTQAKRYSSNGENINLQMILDEGNANPTLQTLQVVYGTCTATSASALETQVGLKGATTADFNARTSTTNWAATTASAANTDHVRFNNTINPASGLTFTWSPCTMPPSAPGSISGTNPVCAATTATYTLAAVAGATTYNWSYSGTGATFTTPTTSPSVAITFAAGATSGTLTVTATNLCGTNATASNLAITVNAAPTATISYPLAAYCINTVGTVSVTQTGTAGGSYSVNPAGLTINGSGGITPSASTAGTYTVTYTFTNGTCSNIATTTVVINPVPALSATATPSLICNGNNSQLQATVASGAGYTVTSIPYVSTAPSGSPTVLWNSYIDDGISGAIALPFTLTYFGQAITQFYVSTNGYIQLQTNSGLTSPAPQTLPDATDPSNVIALAWEDLVVDPSSNPGAYVRYFLNGTTPNRVMIIEYFNLRFLAGSGSENVTGQIKLYENDNHIEVSAGTVYDNGNNYAKTMGIENSTGTQGLAPAGRNNVAWNFTTPEAWSFNPVVGTISYLWTPSTFLSNTTISNPVATGVTSTTAYNVQATNNTTGCIANAPVTVTVASPLNGTYTVGAAGNYPTLTAAVNAYNNLCITGPVVFSLIDATYSASETFPITINSNIYASATNTLTIKPAIGISPTITGNNSVGILKLNGADYITIDGSNAVGGTSRNLSIINTSTNATTSTIIWLNSVDATNGATNNTIKNCVLTGNASTTTFTSLISSGSSVGFVAEVANSNNTYQNNLITKCQTAIAIVGPSGNETGNIITGNTIGSATGSDKLGWSGIEIYQQANCQVTNNTVFGVTSSDVFITTSGISVYGTNSGSTISGNNISDIKHTNSGGYGANGIYLGSSSTAANITVYNNFVSDVAGYGYTGGRDVEDNGYGIIVDYGGGYNIYHNTVNLNTNQNVNGLPACLNVTSFVTTAGSVNVKNNIFTNVQSNGGQHYAIEATAANTVFGVIDYNDYYTASGANLGYIGSNRNNLAAVQTGFGQNTNSLNLLPTYTSSTDFHIQSIAGNSTISNKGNPVSTITTDYDTQTRNGFTPDLGADEWVMPNTGSWVGRISIDWLVAGNWEANVIPGGTTDVTVTGGYTFMPTIVTTQAVNGLAFSKPVPANVPLLTLNAGTLQVNGTLSRTVGMTSPINGSNGTVEMNGSAAQTIPDSMFVSNNLKNLVIGNSHASGVTLAGSLDIYRSVTFSGSGLKLTTGGFLTFKSTATETAWLGNMTGKTITGSATVERYIPNHTKAWQFLAVPTSGQTIKQAWQEGSPAVNGNLVAGYGTQITSNVASATTHPAPGFDVATPAGPSMKVYNRATNKYDGVTSTANLIANTKGYMIFVRGDRSVTTVGAAATATILRTKGTLYTPANPPAVITVTSAAPYTFESIGNPYASAIDLTLLTLNELGGGVQDIFYVWDPKLTTGPFSAYGYGGFQTLTRNGSTYDVTPGGGSYGATTKYIQSGQAFFVNAPFTTGTVKFTEACKAATSSLVNRPENIIPGKQLRTNLYVIKDNEPVLIDGNLVQYDRTYSNSIDMLDAVKLENSAENLGVRSGEKTLVVERRPIIEIRDTIFYQTGQLKMQQYQFEFIANELQQPGLVAFLEDNYLQTSTVIGLNDTTRASFNVDNNERSYATNRFRIVFQKLSPTPVKVLGLHAKRNTDKTINIQWKVDNELNMQLYTVERSANGINFSGIMSTTNIANNGGRSEYALNDMLPLTGDNFYRIKAVSVNGMVQYSAIVKVSAEKTPAGITVYPNPVTGRMIQVQFNNQPSGNYSVRLVNKLGQIVYNDNIQLSSSNTVTAIQLDAAVAAGTYQLIIAGNGNSYSKQVVIQ